MLAADREGFIHRHGLWTEAHYAAAGQMRRVVDELGIDMVRFSFVDQHGILRGKTIARGGIAAAMRSGVTAPSSLLLKDTSGQSVFSVFSSETGVGVDGFSGAGDIVLVPDPTTFRVLPWAPGTAWILCDLRFPDGSPVPFCTRTILRNELTALAARGYDMTVGAELEFHVFRAEDAPLAAEHVGAPGRPGSASLAAPTTRGSQLLLEEGLDRMQPLVDALYRGLTLLDLPLRSIELEFGPSQFEITMEAGSAAEIADAIVLCRTAVRRIAAGLGYHATFMSRPQGAEGASTGWHLHQSLTERATGRGAFVPDAPGTTLSLVGSAYLGGLLAHAGAAAVFTTPTVNGYKRYQPNSLAPTASRGASTTRARWCGRRRGRRPGDPAREPLGRAGGQPVPLHRVAAHQRRRRHRAGSHPARADDRPLPHGRPGAAGIPRGCGRRVRGRRRLPGRARRRRGRLVRDHQEGGIRPLSSPRLRLGAARVLRDLLRTPA